MFATSWARKLADKNKDTRPVTANSNVDANELPDKEFGMDRWVCEVCEVGNNSAAEMLFTATIV